MGMDAPNGFYKTWSSGFSRRLGPRGKGGGGGGKNNQICGKKRHAALSSNPRHPYHLLCQKKRKGGVGRSAIPKALPAVPFPIWFKELTYKNQARGGESWRKEKEKGEEEKAALGRREQKKKKKKTPQFSQARRPDKGKRA